MDKTRSFQVQNTNKKDRVYSNLKKKSFNLLIKLRTKMGQDHWSSNCKIKVTQFTMKYF